MDTTAFVMEYDIIHFVFTAVNTYGPLPLLAKQHVFPLCAFCAVVVFLLPSSVRKVVSCINQRTRDFL
jgi:hypothetical protein